MSPSQFHAKKLEITSTITKSNNNNINGMLLPHLKINKDSHLIKKSSSASSSSSTSSSSSPPLINSMVVSNKPPQHRQPVIIYTHSPRVIHTEPKDFMQLVQRLTGISHPEKAKANDEINIVSSSQYLSPKKEPMSNILMVVGDNENDQKNIVIAKNEENDTSSVITDDHNNFGENQVNSCFITSEAPPMLEPQFNPYITNYSDSLFSYNMRTSIPNSTLGGMEDFGAIDYSS